MIKGVSHAHLGSIWYHSEPFKMDSYSPNQFLGLDFFDVSYSKPALVLLSDILLGNIIAFKTLLHKKKKNVICNHIYTYIDDKMIYTFYTSSFATV